MTKTRVVFGWLLFFILLGFSLHSFIDSGSITIDAWISLLLSPAALAIAVNQNTSNRKLADTSLSIIDEEENEITINKDAPNPEEEGFDIPIM
ncbi:MAG: hypothetical protein VW551_01110 [Euryarchaeota archaeon]